jgi:hypothetical protein
VIVLHCRHFAMARIAKAALGGIGHTPALWLRRRRRQASTGHCSPHPRVRKALPRLPAVAPSRARGAVPLAAQSSCAILTGSCRRSPRRPARLR